MIRLLAIVALILLVALIVSRTMRQVRFVTAKREQPGTSHVQPPAERLRKHVEALAGTFAPRSYRDRENQAKVIDYIHGELAQAGATVHEQPFTAGGEKYVNVVARVGPDTVERIVIGAHYDTLSGTPGADDNASGVAGLIELARELARRELALRVDLIAYANEEPPFFGSEDMGSAAHARSLRQSGVPVRAMISLEMIGYYTDKPGVQQFPSAELEKKYGPLANFAVVAGRPQDAALMEKLVSLMKRTDGVPVHPIAAPEQVPGISLSDHSSYWKYGYPAVMLTDSAFYRNPNYHQSSDTPETLDYARMAKVVVQLADAVEQMSR